MNTIKNYGFRLSPIEDLRAYKLGAIELPKIVFRKDGQWTSFLPIDELQHTPSFDTYGCTVYGTENIQQILERFHYGATKEYDERYNYNLVKINPPGADPHNVAESFRNDGVVSGVLPITSTLEEYAQPRPMPAKYISQGTAHPHELRHQWLWTKPVDKTTRTKLIKEYLQYSPLGVSVTAWSCSSGICVDEGKPNTHWTVLYGYNDKGWLIYDSYAPHRKILSYDHNIEVCKRYQLVPSTRKHQLSIIAQIFQFIGKMLNLIDIPTIEPLPPPYIPEPPLKYDWSISGKGGTAWKSVRIICDEEGLSVKDKNDLCATVGGESGWKPYVINQNKKGNVVVSTDYGIAQINDFYHIGEGKPFLSPKYVLDNPEACIRWMCKQWKAGHKNWWIAYKNGSYKKYL